MLFIKNLSKVTKTVKNGERTLVKISIDAMGGDLGPELALKGASLARSINENIELVFYGQENIVLPILKQYQNLKASEFVHCDVSIDMAQKPSQAIRLGKDTSSMWKAIEAVKTKKVAACISAGNTGALMAMSYLILGMIACASRPAIAGVWPNLRGHGIVLDIGASIGADAEHLVNLAVMGACMSRVLYNKVEASVGLLNIGSEEMKGIDQIKEANNLLKNLNLRGLNYKGFIEGNDIGKGIVDVVVTEGFLGNIALKTAEGTVRQMSTIIKEAMKLNWLTKLSYLLGKKAFEQVKERIDPAKVNGGVLLGLNGIVVKSHGYTSVEGYACAINVAYEMTHNNLQNKIEEGLNHFHSQKQKV